MIFLAVEAYIPTLGIVTVTALIDAMAETYDTSSDMVYNLIKTRQAKNDEDTMVDVLKDVTDILSDIL